jgi:hypothetical protein
MRLLQHCDQEMLMGGGQGVGCITYMADGLAGCTLCVDILALLTISKLSMFSDSYVLLPGHPCTQVTVQHDAGDYYSFVSKRC